jgi:2-polyprenyl-6-methoxyphenol hydroxylase-like FAD-dependent oxidoreductase
VLLGDAGHSVTPSAGLGCNSALEDCAVLDKVLAAAELGGDAIHVAHIRHRRFFAAAR